jgi:hypothetical protein
MDCASLVLASRRVCVLLAALACAHSRTAAADDFIFQDGFEIALNAAFFVSPQGFDTNAGTQVAPFLTISKGIAAAAAHATNKTVIVAGGTYSESIALADGVHVFGQYQSGTWTRDPANATVINGSTLVGNHLRTVTAAATASATTLDGFQIYGAVNDIAGGNSYAIYVSASSPNLRITNNVIYGGRGGAGAAGSVGGGGSQGNDGTTYSATLDSFTATGTGKCNTSNNRDHSGGGTLTCSAAVDGGDGGGNHCTPARSTQNSASASPAADGLSAGGSGDGSGGSAGTAGYDGEWNSSTCFLPASGVMSGGDGTDGGNGVNATPAVAGCAAPAGSAASGDWSTDTALGGSAGTNGGGGGGGGAGGGAACTTDGTCKDMLGGHGGGAGSGGCGGDGGSGGAGGGGAFDIFVFGGTAPTVRGNTLFLGDGGDGGNGGDGRVGGLGGVGKAGGQIGALSCTGRGGHGGNGGNGGHGSGGGGGCGGASFGIYTQGVGTPDYCSSGKNTSYGGFPGSAGSGGASLGNPGGAGQVGVMAACSFN